MRPSRSGIVIGFIGVLACGAAGAAWASGFAVREGSADWTANAFAGNSAKAYDAGTAWTNPAGMVRLDSNEIDASVSYIDPYSHFEGLDVGAARMVYGGSEARNGARSVFTGGLFGVWGYSPDLKFGLAATSPYGNTTEYPGDWGGRYQSLIASVLDAQVLFSAAYRINDQFSVGGGPVFDYFHAKLGQAVNNGPASNLVGDPQGAFEGGDFAVGYDIGSLWQVSDALRFGANYRSRISHDISGEESVSVPAGLSVLSPMTAAQLTVSNGGAHTQVTLPDSASVGAYWQVEPDLALLAEIQWTHWSLFHNLMTTSDMAVAPSSNVLENWRNTWFGSVGANWQMLDVLMLQTGVAFDETPISSAQYRYAAIPDTNRIIVGVGFTYAMMQGLDLNFGYGHIFAQPGGVQSNAAPNAGTLVGKVYNEGDTVSMGVRAKF